MLGLEKCYKCPASFTHKHSLQSSHLHDCKCKKTNAASTETKLWQNSTYVKKDSQAEIKLK